MKTLKQLLFTLMAVVGISLSVSAQKDDQRRPPKGNPPVIRPGEKPPRDNPPPRDENKPKKPGFSVLVAPGQPRSDEII
jgi:hypothetical protein